MSIDIYNSIYSMNKRMKPYHVNFHYSLKKQGIFIIEGWSPRERLYTSYFLAALGSILFFFTMSYGDQISQKPALYYSLFIFSAISLVAGIYILYHFYQRVLNLRYTVLVRPDGISFREKDVILNWKREKIKSVESILTISKSEALRPTNTNLKLKRTGKIIVFNQLGQRKELLTIRNSDREELKNDLEDVKKLILNYIQIEVEIIQQPIVEEEVFA